MVSNIKVAFLNKNTISRTQPLAAVTIKVWKVYYKKKLLRHIVSQVDRMRSASHILKSVNLLMAVQWMVNAWDEVKSDVISVLNMDAFHRKCARYREFSGQTNLK